MFSGFLKKLLFAREFSIIDGEVKVLGNRYIMLPAELLFSAIKELDEKEIESFSTNFIKNLMPRLAASGEGNITFITEIFDIYGLGKLSIEDINPKNKKAVLVLQDFPVLKNEKKNEIFLKLASSILVSYFSEFFHKRLSVKSTKISGSYAKFILG
ncbi:MAG: hypothetical protein V1859_09700 [archaeon]